MAMILALTWCWKQSCSYCTLPPLPRCCLTAGTSYSPALAQGTEHVVALATACPGSRGGSSSGSRWCAGMGMVGWGQVLRHIDMGQQGGKWLGWGGTDRQQIEHCHIHPD